MVGLCGACPPHSSAEEGSVQCACNAGYQRLCPDGWTQMESTCVRFYPTALNWASARQRCVELGGNLAYPANQTQQDLLWSRAGVQAWIGVDRSQGSWRTPEGQAISYSKWCPGQPDSSSSGYCGLIGGSGSEGMGSMSGSGIAGSGISSGSVSGSGSGSFSGSGIESGSGSEGMGWESSGCWDDYACGQSRPYLCQMDPFGPCTLCPADTYTGMLS
jgi:hypothetical protein